ncbi:MAG: class I SAM-dependent RNA methyltransferase [Clostridiales bacterium]|nr:class I SAM-dependent RNA methyltransferase [Clostridiales bacterium]
MMIWIATAAFGLEGLVKRELLDLGLDARPELGGVRFEGDSDKAFEANLWLRTADRVLLLTGEGQVLTFEELFQLVLSIPWEDYLPADARFPVSGHCARSQLMSVRDCQSIIKKAIVERLKKKYRRNQFEETGSIYAVSFSIHNNQAKLMLDASGDALNRRGYRTWNGEAPLRETLAAALVELSPWQPGQPLYDPCCGTGTILVEAAFRAARRAPGLKRAFAMENWQFVDVEACRAARQAAEARFDLNLVEGIGGSDVDEQALSLCKKHLQQAGLGGRVRVHQQDMRDLPPFLPNTCVIANPPYGQRLGDKKGTETLYRQMRWLDTRAGASQVCVLTANPAFERLYGRRCTKKRRLYNGRLECEYLIFA